MLNNNEFIKIPLEINKEEKPIKVKKSQEIDEVLKNLSIGDANFLRNNFQPNSILIFDNYHINIISLVYLKSNLRKLGLQDILFFKESVVFIFKNVSVKFLGEIKIFKSKKIFSVGISNMIVFLDEGCKFFHEMIIRELEKFDALYFCNILKLYEKEEEKIKGEFNIL